MRCHINWVIGTGLAMRSFGSAGAISRQGSQIGEIRCEGVALMFWRCDNILSQRWWFMVVKMFGMSCSKISLQMFSLTLPWLKLCSVSAPRKFRSYSILMNSHNHQKVLYVLSVTGNPGYFDYLYSFPPRLLSSDIRVQVFYVYELALSLLFSYCLFPYKMTCCRCGLWLWLHCGDISLSYFISCLILNITKKQIHKIACVMNNMED